MPIGKLGALEKRRDPDGYLNGIIYARVSSSSQDVENSTDAQTEHGKLFFEENRIRIRATFVDKARSGRADHRPDFLKMIEQCEVSTGDVDCIVVWKFSRFFRNRDESVLYKRRLKKRGIEVISINEPVDDSPQGRMMEGIYELFDEFQSATSGQDVSRGTSSLAAEGFFLGGKAPFGMRKVPVRHRGRMHNKLEPDPTNGNADAIRRLFDLLIYEGHTESQITKTLNQEGRPGPNGKPWKCNRIDDFAKNPAFEGTIVWGRTSTHYDGAVICRDAHPGIVTHEEFEQAAQILATRHHKSIHPRNSGTRHALSGLVKCGQCKSSFIYRMEGRHGNYRHVLRCNGRTKHTVEYCDNEPVRAEIFEALILRVILQEVLTTQNISSLLQKVEAQHGAKHLKRTESYESIQTQIDSLEKKQKDLLDLYLSHDLTRERFRQKDDELAQAVEVLRVNRQQLQSEETEQTIILENPGAVLDYVEEICSHLQKEEPGRCRAWLSRFVKTIWVMDGDVAEIEYKLPVPGNGGRPPGNRPQVQLKDDVCSSTRYSPPSREQRIIPKADVRLPGAHPRVSLTMPGTNPIMAWREKAPIPSTLPVKVNQRVAKHRPVH